MAIVPPRGTISSPASTGEDEPGRASQRAFTASREKPRALRVAPFASTSTAMFTASSARM